MTGLPGPSLACERNSRNGVDCGIPAFRFLLWRHSKSGVLRLQLKAKFVYFFVSHSSAGISCNMVNTLPLSKGIDSAFFRIFPIGFWVCLMFSGTISLNGNFLKNGSMNFNEILSGSLPSQYKSIPILKIGDLLFYFSLLSLIVHDCSNSE